MIRRVLGVLGGSFGRAALSTIGGKVPAIAREVLTRMEQAAVGRDDLVREGMSVGRFSQMSRKTFEEFREDLMIRGLYGEDEEEMLAAFGRHCEAEFRMSALRRFYGEGGGG